MESQDDNTQTENRKFQLYERPWLSLLAVVATSVLLIILAGIVIFVLIGLPYDSPTSQSAVMISYHILTVFLFAPFILRLPKGKRTFKQYLDDIGLSRMQPFFRLVLLGLSCYIIRPDLQFQRQPLLIKINCLSPANPLALFTFLSC